MISIPVHFIREPGTNSSHQREQKSGLPYALRGYPYYGICHKRLAQN